MLVSALARARAAFVWRPARLLAAALLTGLAFGAAPAFAQSSADLVVNQTDSPDPGPAGGVFTYTVRIDNNGPDTAVAASVVNTLPPGSTFVSASTTHGSCGAPLGGVLTCPLGDLPFLDQATVTITVILPTPGVYVNTVSASATTPDPNPANNTDRTEDTTAINASNMTLAVVDTPDPVAAGANYSYAVTAINNGPAPATSQTISFPVPTGACVRSVPTGSGWSCTPSGGYPRCSGTISCVRNTTLANGASAPQLTVPAVANVGGSITGAFTVSSPLPDGDPTDNTITATTTVTGGSSDVQMTKTASPATVGVGSNVTYTLTPRFNGGEPPGAGAQRHHGDGHARRRIDVRLGRRQRLVMLVREPGRDLRTPRPVHGRQFHQHAGDHDCRHRHRERRRQQHRTHRRPGNRSDSGQQ